MPAVIRGALGEWAAAGSRPPQLLWAAEPRKICRRIVTPREGRAETAYRAWSGRAGTTARLPDGLLLSRFCAQSYYQLFFPRTFDRGVMRC